jgi:hypothetical protein
LNAEKLVQKYTISDEYVKGLREEPVKIEPRELSKEENKESTKTNKR